MSQLMMPMEDQEFTLRFSETFSRLVGADLEGAWPDAFGRALVDDLSSSGVKGIRTLSLFAGAGGLDIGFHDAGFEIVEAVELEEKFTETLRANAVRGGYLDGVQPRCIDVCEYDPDPELQVDFVIGGPPCQTFSAAGRRASGVMGTDDPRGRLFLEYVRVLEILRPTAFVFENVYGIVGAQGGKPWRAVCEAFRDIGYRVHSRVLDAADYGVPQHRERLIIVGTESADYRFPRPTHGPDSPDQAPYYSASEAVESVETGAEWKGLGGRYGYLLADVPPGLNYSFFTARMGHPEPVFAWRSKFSDFLYKADPELPVRTIKAQGGQYTGPFSWHNRPFTVSELKRLQTFPDAYDIVGGRGTAIHQIGNSVPPQLARIIALSIREQVFGAQIPIELSYLRDGEKLGFRTRKRKLTVRYEEKARVALEERANQGKHRNSAKRARTLTNGDLVRWVGPSFEWTEDAAAGTARRVNVRLEIGTTEWSIALSGSSWRAKPKFRIEITPSGEGHWPLPVDRIELVGHQLDTAVYRGVWSALEEVVAERTGVADLVQLNGYYQYPSSLSARMKCLSGKPDQVWEAMTKVVSGIGVARNLDSMDLACLWGLAETDADRIEELLRALRGIGYEVRSHGTNAQMKAGEFLLPYRFPTLTPMSVQLRKTL